MKFSSAAILTAFVTLAAAQGSGSNGDSTGQVNTDADTTVNANKQEDNRDNSNHALIDMNNVLNGNNIDLIDLLRSESNNQENDGDDDSSHKKHSDDNTDNK